MKQDRAFYFAICAIVFGIAGLVLIILTCKPNPEFYINGKPFHTKERCAETKSETKWEWHYGANWLNGGKWEYHYGPNTTTKCVKWVIDTIEIK